MKTVKIADLKQHKRNDELPQLTKDERTGLKRLIELHGFTEAIEITKNNVILDGHNRVSIAKELNMKELPYRIIDIEEHEEFKYILDKNSSRRQMTQKKIAYLRGKLYLTTKGDGSGSKSEQIAKEDSVSEKTVRRDAKYAEDLETITSDCPNIKEKILNNEIKATKEQIQEVASLPKEEQHKILEKANDTKDLMTAYEELHGTHIKGDKVPDFRIETIKTETSMKLKKVENVLINKIKELDKKKKIHVAFEALNKKIEKILQDER